MLGGPRLPGEPFSRFFALAMFWSALLFAEPPTNKCAGGQINDRPNNSELRDFAAFFMLQIAGAQQVLHRRRGLSLLHLRGRRHLHLVLLGGHAGFIPGRLA